jgi:hypothetical protein
MKSISNLTFISLLSILVFSCKSELEKHQNAFNDCVEKKKNEKNYKYGNIQEALNAYDFEIARDYLACHPSMGELISGGVISGKRFDNPYSEDLNLIVRAEITYFLSQGEFKKAESSAKEAGMMELYEKISGESFEKNLDKMIEKKEFNKIFSFLSEEKAKYKDTKYDLSTHTGNNSSYNPTIRVFNNLIEKVLDKYNYMKVEKSEIKAVIDLSLPELEDILVNDYPTRCKLVETFKKEATAKYLK